jgi:tyrosyl-tRNA synthetase
MNIIDELKWRGAVNQQTDEEGLYKLVGEEVDFPLLRHRSNR